MATHDIASIFSMGFENYVKRCGHQLPYDHYKVAHSIMACRTDTLGGHIYKCNGCGHEHVIHNSCSNRHCPKCQAMARIQWVQARIGELLPVPYFHAVFTVPSELNPFILRNKATCYSILFRAAQETLSVLSADAKHLGARTGAVLVLHSWGQNLMDHPHIHCIIPAGGLNLKTEKWKKGKGRFLFPVKAMSALFRGKFMDYFKADILEKNVKMNGLLSQYKDSSKLKPVLNSLYEKKWVTYIKEPFAGAESVIRYLGNYTHRIAISNHRILDFRDDKVKFSWRDYKDNNKTKVMVLSIHEFIRRFLLHVVPNGFMRIRHYGILGNRCKANLLPLCRALIDGITKEEYDEREDDDDGNKKTIKKKWYEVIQELTGSDPRICPFCKKGTMNVVRIIPGKKRQQQFNPPDTP